MLNKRYPLCILSKYGSTLHQGFSLDTVIKGDIPFFDTPDFILIKKKDIPVLQGLATILGVDVVNVELSDSPKPIELLYLNTRILLLYPCKDYRLTEIVRRIPSPKYDHLLREILYLISVE